ncbi:MAG: hypothetical protein LBG99_06400 [Propionibacteriaceae bacterium]|jgi:hypothetical protein|nr:hypothetical protein [Propionibacteriaceae bacterium]
MVEVGDSPKLPPTVAIDDTMLTLLSSEWFDGVSGNVLRTYPGEHMTVNDLSKLEYKDSISISILDPSVPSYLAIRFFDYGEDEVPDQIVDEIDCITDTDRCNGSHSETGFQFSIHVPETPVVIVVDIMYSILDPGVSPGHLSNTVSWGAVLGYFT